MKTMMTRMLDATDRLIAQQIGFENCLHFPEKEMAVYECEDETLFAHVIAVDEWKDMDKDERKFIEAFIKDYMLQQDELRLGKITLACVEFIIKNNDTALVRVEYVH